MSVNVPANVLAFRGPAPSGHFPLSEALCCAECWTVFSSRVTHACPSCTATSGIEFVETLLRRRDGQAHTDRTLRELARLGALKSA